MTFIFIFILLLLLPTQMNGQEHSFIEQGKTWHVKGRVLYPPCELEETYCFTEESDTLVGDVHYMRLFKDNDGSQETSGLFREVDGSQARRIEMKLTDPSYDETYSEINVWIEGIGNLLHPLLNVGNMWDGAPIYTVLSVTRGNDVLYRNTPTGISGTCATKDAESPTYDLQGRKVEGKPSRGIYIIGGKKRVVE